MKQYVRFMLGLALLAVTGLTPVVAQVFNPNDPVVTYNPAAPPSKPASGQVGKWVRTPRVSFSTTSFKCYIYNDIPFRLKYPKNYDPAKTYPILVFFHGIGEFGTIYDNEYQLYLGGQKHSSAVDNGTFNGFLLYPQSQSQFWADGAVANVNKLIETIMVPQLNVDPFRIYVNGLSAGGNTTWGYLRNHTKSVAAITPISSAFQSYANDVQKYKYTPIYHFQGALDEDPSPITSRKLGNTILNAGGNYRYREFANQGHSCWNVAWSDGDYFPFYAKAHKANPWPAFGKSEFCAGEAINTTIGVTAGFEGYEWRRNGALIAGATANELTVTETGTYDCRILKGTRWSPWSPTPVVIKMKATVAQPVIKVVGLASRHLPAPDGSTAVNLEVNGGYATYNWQRQDNGAILSTTRLYTASQTGNYIMQVTDKFSCQKSTFKIDAEDYIAMAGVVQQTSSDLAPGLKVSSIDLNDYMDYTIDVPAAASYTFTARIAAKVDGAQFQVRDGNGNVIGTLNIPNTGSEETWSEVSVPVYLYAGVQTLRIQSSATPRWDINYFQLTGGNTGNFTNVFTVVDANGINPPEPATNLSTSVLSQTSVKVAWKQAPAPAYNETGFEVYQASAESGPYKLVAITAANATNATIGGLNAGAEYFYKVRAINNTAASAVSASVSVVTQADVTPPTAPINLRLGTISKTSIRLYWNKATDDIGVVKYDVYINGVKASVTSALDMYVYHLFPNTTYTFTVRARDLGNNSSPFSNAVTAKTKTGSITADPSMVPANPYDHSVYLNMNLENPAAAPWNNMNVLPSAGDVSDNLKNYAGNYSGIKMTIVDNFSGYNAGGMNTGNNSGVYPDNVIRSAYYNDQGNVAKLRIDGLSLRHKYSFVFFGSRNGGGDRTTIYKINNQSVSLNASMNIANTVQIDNVVTDVDGAVFIEVSLASGASFAYLNSLVIKGTYVESAPANNEAPVVNAGIDQTISLPANSLALSGSATDANGTIASYSWTRVSGPAPFTFNNSSASDPTVSNLEEGVYTFRLTATDNEGLSSFDDIQVTVNAAPPAAGTRSLMVNIFGGTTPYNNPAWFNWNVSSSLGSGALTYSDGTASGIAATLSKSSGITDNGATYSGGMAPAEVLRHVSSSTTARTLTFTGLYTGATYSLELYASRNNNSTYSTTFTINGVAQSVNTYRNFTNNIVFTNLVPNAQGQLVVNISSAQAYNYINGFTLVETVPEQQGAVTSANTTEGAFSANRTNDVVNNVGLSVRAYPNPSSNAFNLVINKVANNNEPVQLRVFDAAGRIVEQRQNVVPNSNLQLGTDYRSGIYYVEISQGTNKTLSKLIKNSK